MENILITLEILESLAEKQNEIILELMQTVHRQALEICQLQQVESCECEILNRAGDLVREYKNI